MLKPHIREYKREWLFLIFILILASTVRLWDLSAAGFNTDEAVYGGQSATLAGYEKFSNHFSIYRAHPLLLQSIISILFANFGVVDTIARIVPVVFGIATVLVVYLLGKMLLDSRSATIGALIVALLPYHIIVTRQVLLDVPLSFFFTLTLFFLVRYIKTSGGSHLLFLIGASSGLCVLSKEIGIFAIIATIASLILTKRMTLKVILIIFPSFLFACIPYWLPILTSEHAQDAALSYWQWQTSRDPNLSETFYMHILFESALGYAFSVLFVLSIIYVIKRRLIKNPEIKMLLVWVGVPLILFQVIPVKGYHFIISIVPPLVLVGIIILSDNWIKNVRLQSFLMGAIVVLIIITSGPVLNQLFQNVPPPLAGTGGVPYVREGAVWIGNNVPENNTLLTVDTRTANIIKFYANNDAISLHSNKNPAYVQIIVPDLYILDNQIRYIVSEPYIAESFPYLKEEVDMINDLIVKYNGIPIHTEYKTYHGKNGENLTKPAFIIYALKGFQEE